MYHLNLCLISIISLFRRSKLTTYLIYLLLIYLSIFDGTRFETGPDWDSYLLHFYKGEYSQNFEWMYNKYVEFFRIIYPNYNVFLFIISLFLYFSLFKKIMIYSKSNVSLIVLYSMVVPYIGINRQLISIGIIVYSIKYILEKELLKFTITVALASCFHITASLFLICYLCNYINYFKKNNRIKIYFFMVLFSIFGWNLFKIIFYCFEYFFPFLNKYTPYFSYEIRGFSLVGFITRILEIFIPLFLLNEDKLKKEDKKLLNITILSLLFSFLIYIIFSGKFSILVSRGTLIYKIIFLPILYGIAFKTLEGKIIKKFIFIIFIIIFCQLILYKSIIISEFSYQYLYKNIFLK